ncbi:uncharacterized protein TRIADDRAFT_61462 [Trichoplax adhaerens]|uniref:Uncharacterized protein n=1 Tax=Trichoplax adhaerens TaxID=10228 RepID=B3SB20_TRIAD|nr:hypothetical protein TRIADDRAFT_61462 [Trichoplax adhaerens]EDV20085.1 hypothetical protein TRIADDRAFT_61462 [Trichoplax adhaerens]|eukprot:XP_002117469.1 hypothetical protein TRIADDRAFT_61462 [Trichoplax adhaerens]
MTIMIVIRPDKGDILVRKSYLGDRDDESAGIEKPESFVFKYLTLEQTQALLELNIDVLQEARLFSTARIRVLYLAESITGKYSSLYQHYKLYKNFFTTDQEQENLHLAYDIEHPPILNIDYPLPMDEGISEQVLQLDEQAKAEEAEAQKAREEAELLAAQIEEAKDEGTVEENKQDEVELVPEESTLPLKDVKDLIKTVTNDVLDGLQVDVNQKLRDREAVMLNKINRIQNYLRN